MAKMVNNHPQLILVDEFSNAMEARIGIENNEIDLIFLDVEMPIINGFHFLESLDNPPQVVLITGKPEYALKAFDYDVTDYLHKPITLSRFDVSVRRAVGKYEQMHKVKENEEHIFVKSHLQKRRIVLNNIKWIEALGDYMKLVTDETNVIILSTMKSLELQLPEDKFLRVHKSFIVNLEKVEKFNRKYVEIGGTRIPISRRNGSKLVRLLNREDGL